MSFMKKPSKNQAEVVGAPTANPSLAAASAPPALADAQAAAASASERVSGVEALARTCAHDIVEQQERLAALAARDEMDMPGLLEQENGKRKLVALGKRAVELEAELVQAKAARADAEAALKKATCQVAAAARAAPDAKISELVAAFVAAVQIEAERLDELDKQANLDLLLTEELARPTRWSKAAAVWAFERRTSIVSAIGAALDSEIRSAELDAQANAQAEREIAEQNQHRAAELAAAAAKKNGTWIDPVYGPRATPEAQIDRGSFVSDHPLD